MSNLSAATSAPLIDPFGRRISYLRLSVTDRCDLRCVYCMPERMAFLPRKDVLSFEELYRLACIFIDQGVRKIRLTGGEPLVRKDILTLVNALGEQLEKGALDELTLTTNGVLLAQYAAGLAKAGVKRINVSLDTLDAELFERIARRDRLSAVLDGIDAAQRAGIHVKLNTVALRHDNAAEIPAIIEWAHAKGLDISLIEVMPMGDVDEDRIDQYIPLTDIKATLEQAWTLTRDDYKTGGPSRYYRVEQTGGRIGFISPLTGNFCDGCNRVRLTCTGKLYMCLGQGNETDFRTLMRDGADDAALREVLQNAIAHKPLGHDFKIDKRGDAPALARTMSVTGG